MIKNKNLNTLFAGFVSAFVVSIVMIMGTRFMGLSMDMGELLGVNNPLISMPYFMGWIMHFIVGIIFAFIFAYLLEFIPGNTNLIKGLIYGFALFLVAQIVIMPMMGLGLFSGFNMMVVIGSLFGHLILGAILGVMIK